VIIFARFKIKYLYIMPRASTAGTGARSTGVNYATAALFDSMYRYLGDVSHQRQGALAFAVSYQAQTGPGGGSLKRAARGLRFY
jgi:hypothetical protein